MPDERFAKILSRQGVNYRSADAVDSRHRPPGSLTPLIVLLALLFAIALIVYLQKT